MNRTVNATLAADWAFISARDPALDQGAAGLHYGRYLETRDESALVFVAGMPPPARFTIRALTRAERRELEGQSPGDMFAAACAMALRSIDGFQVDGAPVHAQHDRRGRATEETLDALGHLLTQEVGQAAVYSARLSDKFS